MSGTSIAVFARAKFAIARFVQSQGDYVVFLDGDCLVRPDFIATHRRLAEPGWFVTGNRALLTKISDRCGARTVRSNPSAGALPIGWGSGSTAGSIASRRCCACRSGRCARLRPPAWEGARSCNLAVWRADLDRVDGFDAAFSGWGKEDSDLLVRLLHAGVRRKDGAFATGVLHLWHPDADRSRLAENERLLADVARKCDACAPVGGCRRSRWVPPRSIAMINRARFVLVADVLAAALVVSLPWSTSATGILLGLWLLALIPALDVASLRRVVATPAGGIPVLLWLLGLAGMLWAFGVPMAERWDGAEALAKLLVIPLLMAQFRNLRARVVRADRLSGVLHGPAGAVVAAVSAAASALVVPGAIGNARRPGQGLHRTSDRVRRLPPSSSCRWC